MPESTRTLPVFHVIVVSNFAQAFDKYTRLYRKSALPLSTYPNQFFVLSKDELPVGAAKASKLLTKLNLPGDRLLVLEGLEAESDLHENSRTGLGRYLAKGELRVQAVHWLENGALSTCSVEDAYAASLKVLHPQLIPYAQLQPRTLSVLPIASACQAKCQFCFSESSVSLEQAGRLQDVSLCAPWLVAAKHAGAERFVITGGGEPGLLPHASLLRLMEQGRAHLGKVVLISNGVHLAREPEAARQAKLLDYRTHGLSVLAISRHHHSAAINASIMGLATRSEDVLASLAAVSRALAHLSEAPADRPTLRARLVCVLQRGGIESTEDVIAYLRWAVQRGVAEVCFKELYVSTQQESAYHGHSENQWSLENQVSLSRVLMAADMLGMTLSHTLPWGAPVFRGVIDGAAISVAAYTEPSLFWERSSGVARSWNLMADGSCLTSLEDPRSGIRLTAEGAVRNQLPGMTQAA